MGIGVVVKDLTLRFFGMYFFMGSVALLAAAGDVRMLVRGLC